MSKVIFVLSALLIYYHMFMFFCKKCSFTLMWWMDIFGNPALKYVNLVFSVFLLINIVLFIKQKTSFHNLVKFGVYFFSVLNIVFWVVQLAFIGFPIQNYVVVILLHVFLIVLLARKKAYKSLSSDNKQP